MIKRNPTDVIDINFDAYVQQRLKHTQAHTDAGMPDYAYGMDFVLRQKMKGIPGLFPLFKALSSQIVPAMKQKYNLENLKVGPNQFPDIYEMTVDCARRLGIGIPTVFIEQNPSTINAYAYATEDDAPLIVITSALAERYTPDELKAIIGHECGHIHNNHGIYNTAAMVILEAVAVGIPGIQQILQLATLPIRYALNAWSRAAEVTCDRAGVICSNDIDAGIYAQAKSLYGGTFNRTTTNIDAIIKQYDMIRSTPVRFLELEASHPVSVRRIFAIREFQNSEVLYKWRPEWKKPGMELLNKQELDARCEKYVSVVKSGKER